MKYKILHDREKCIGCGTCVALCPENWEFDDEGKVKPKKTEIDEIGCNKEAKESCPVEAIKIEEIKDDG